MYFRILIFTLFSIVLAGCSHRNEPVNVHEEVKFQYTAYNHDYELFAEADPFVAGETANILSHFTELSDFNPLETGKVTVSLTINGKVTGQTLDLPNRKGIYSFNIRPEASGTGVLKYVIFDKNDSSELIFPEVSVFSSHEEAHEAAENSEVSTTNATVFTKEQSWKINFSTEKPEVGPFGQVIKTTALIQAAPGDETIVAGKISGIITLSGENLQEGIKVTNGQTLFKISGSESSENNFTVRYSEAKNNFEKARADYERAKELAADRIVSEKELLNTRNQFENANIIFDNLNENFNASGQSIVSPTDGFVKQIFVKNGSFVEAGQPVLIITKNKILTLTADVPQKYSSVLGSIHSANIRTSNNDQIFTLEQLNGKIISYGKSTNTNNYLIPVSLQIENKSNFLPGSLAEVYLKTLTNNQAITIPNSSLLEEQGINFVYVQITPELFEKREVKVGVSDGIRSEILSGISPDNRIVTKGAILIKLSQSTGTLDAHSGHVH